MKIIKTILLITVLFFVSNADSFAQMNSGYINYKGEFIKRFKVGLGWASVETDQKPYYVLDGFDGWSGSYWPKTLHLDYRFDPKIRLNMGISSTTFFPRTVVDSVAIYDDATDYFGFDLNVLYNFRAFKKYATLKNTWTLKNLHKEHFYFDGYFLAGLGYNTIGFPTLNTGVGTDFWITYRWGVNFQTVAKWTTDPSNRLHMHHTFGVVYHIDEGNDAGALGTLRKNRNYKH